MKARCKMCGAWSDDIDPGKNSFTIHYPAGFSWYGPKYSPEQGWGFKHNSLAECPFTRGLKPAEILEDKDIEKEQASALLG